LFPKSRAASARSRSFSSRETSSIPPHPARRRRRSSFTPSSISLKRLRTGRRHRETTTIPGGARGGRALNATQEHPRSGESHGPPRAVSSTRPRTRSVASCAGRASGSAATPLAGSSRSSTSHFTSTTRRSPAAPESIATASSGASRRPGSNSSASGCPSSAWTRRSER